LKDQLKIKENLVKLVVVANQEVEVFVLQENEEGREALEEEGNEEVLESSNFQNLKEEDLDQMLVQQI